MSGKKQHHKKNDHAASESKQEQEVVAPTAETLEELAKEFNNAQSAKPEKSDEKTALLEQQINQLTDKILRLNAEMENMRRRHQKEKSEAQSSGIKNFAGDMSNVLDNLYRALENMGEEQVEGENELITSLRTGVEMTKKVMESSFERYKIKRISPLGEDFNHNYHQAISQVDAPEQESGVVIQVIQPGYTIEDKLLRPALVVVSK